MPRGVKIRTPDKRSLSKELTVRALSAGDRPYIVWDDSGSGLGVRVWPSGRKTYLVTYQHGGKTRWYHLGRYPAVPLALARKNASEIKAKATLGSDPQGEKIAARHRHREEINFAALAAEYVTAKADMRALPQYERSLKHDTLPIIGKIKAVDVTDTDIERVVARMEQRGVSAAYAVNVVSAIYTWATVFRRPKLKMAINPTKAVAIETGDARERVLSVAEIATLWPLFGDGDGGRALKLMLLSGQRSGEVGKLTWEQIGPDWWWNLPESKNGRPHRIWIGPLVRPLLGQRCEAGPVFSAVHGTEDQVNARITRAFRRAAALAGIPTGKADGNARPHDLRRTMTTLAAEYGVTDAFMLDRMTNHALKGEQKTYQRAGFLRQMRAAWDSWADLLLDRIVTGKIADDTSTKVVRLDEAAA